MGLRSKQVPGDLEYWSQTLLPPHTAEELPKPPLIRRQQPLQQQAEPLNCPRCGSINTKFCYYNNYNKSQPRHFCKSCKRHWTKGGTLRNLPAGGGRKSKRPRISNTATTMTAASTATSTATTATAPRQQDCPNQTSMSSIPYKALTGSVSSVSSPLLLNTTNGISISKPVKSFGLTNTTGLYASTPQNPNTEYPLLSTLSTTFDHKYTSLINPTSYKSLNDYSLNLDSMEESTITTLDIPNTSSTPWPGPDTISSMDMPNYWNWNEIDILTSSSDLNIAWDDVINP